MKKTLFFPAIIFLVIVFSGCTVRETSPQTKHQQLSESEWRLTDSDSKGQLSLKDNSFTLTITNEKSGNFTLSGSYAADEKQITVVTENADAVELLYNVENGVLTLTYYENTLRFDSVKDNTL